VKEIAVLFGAFAASGMEFGQGVGGVLVEVVPGAVVAAGGAGVGVASGVLHPVQRHPGVEGQGDERVAQVVRVQAARLVHPGGGREAAYQPPDRGPVEAGPAGAEKQRPGASVRDVGLEGIHGLRGERHGGPPAALAHDPQHPVPAFGVDVADVEGAQLGGPQPIKGEQQHQGVVPGRAGAGCGDERGKRTLSSRNRQHQ